MRGGGRREWPGIGTAIEVQLIQAHLDELEAAAICEEIEQIDGIAAASECWQQWLIHQDLRLLNGEK